MARNRNKVVKQTRSKRVPNGQEIKILNLRYGPLYENVKIGKTI